MQDKKTFHFDDPDILRTRYHRGALLYGKCFHPLIRAVSGRCFALLMPFAVSPK
jgi:hypothetical protein